MPVDRIETAGHCGDMNAFPSQRPECCVSLGISEIRKATERGAGSRDAGVSRGERRR